MSNSATLAELRVNTQFPWCAEDVHLVAYAAPRAMQLLELSLDIGGISDDYQPPCALLRNEAPFQAVRLVRLHVRRNLFRRNLTDTADVLAFISDLRHRASLDFLDLYGVMVDTPAVMGAFVDACIAIRLRSLQLGDCRVVPAVLPELTRLIAVGALQMLFVSDSDIDKAHVQMFDAAHESTWHFVAAVRASDMTRLVLDGMGVQPESVVEAAAMINARLVL